MSAGPAGVGLRGAASAASVRAVTVAAIDQQRFGLTLPFPGVALADSEELIRQAEQAGYDDLWTGDTAGPDGFTPLALAAAWTERGRLGAGDGKGFTRGPAGPAPP